MSDQRTTHIQSPRILILGVNPFEDVPGFQLLGLLKERFGGNILAADDSEPAIRVLEQIGAKVHHVPDPSTRETEYLSVITDLCNRHKVDMLIPANDAHLSTLSRNYSTLSSLLPPCPMIAAINSLNLFNKWLIQDWLSNWVPVPRRWVYNSDMDLERWEQTNGFPVMVKGMRKGAIKCSDHIEAIAARRAILENPVNRGTAGGGYLEEYINGEEHSILFLARRGTILSRIGLRKLACTKLGTTVLAEVGGHFEDDIDLRRIATSMFDVMVLEMEYRITPEGKRFFFEGNLRFPSWVGALGVYGKLLVESYVELSLADDEILGLSPLPLFDRMLIYRLPQAGPLTLQQAFAAREDATPVSARNQSWGSSNQPRLLWQGCSPYEFRTK